MPLCHRPHQRGLLVLVFLRVDVRAVSQQRLHRPGIARAGARHQRRLAVQQRCARVGAGREKPLDHRGAAVRARQMKRSDPEIVGDVRARASPDQQIGDREVVAMRRPMERGRAIALRRVHVDSCRPPLQQGAHRFNISVLDGLDEPQIRGRGCGDRARRDDENRQTDGRQTRSAARPGCRALVGRPEGLGYSRPLAPLKGPPHITEKGSAHRFFPCCRRSDRSGPRTDPAASGADWPAACS